MRIALVIPPFQDFYTTAHRMTFIGLNTLADWLSSIRPAPEWKVFPFPLMKTKGVPLPESLQYLRPFLLAGEKSSWRFFTHYMQFGPDSQSCLEVLKQFSPQGIVVSHFAYAYSDSALEFLELLSRAFPDIPIAAGGGGVSADPSRFTFAGVRAFPGLLEDLKGPLLDFLGLENAHPHPEKAPDGSPGVCFSSSPVKKGRYSVSLSRGCPMQCRFCSQFICHGREFRKASREDIVSAIEKVPPQAMTGLNLEDDNILYDKELFFWFLEEILSRFPRVRFSAENGLDYRLMTPELMDRLAGYGFEQFNFSLAVLKKDRAQSQKRETRLQSFSALLYRAQQLKIPVISYFIAGLQGESAEDSLDTLLYLSRLPTQIGISPFYPVPGLPDLTEQQTRKALLQPQWCRGSSHYPWNDMSTEELLTLFRLTRLTNVLKAARPPEDVKILYPQMLASRRLLTLQKKGSSLEAVEVPGMVQELVEGWFRGFKPC